MSKASKIDRAIEVIAGIAGLYFVGIAIAGAVKRRKEGIEGVGRIKRRIYKEVSLAQNAGVDFSKKFPELTAAEITTLEDLGHSMTWKQSSRSAAAGKSYAESYYNSLRRAWNAVSGVCGIGAAYNVKNADGKVVLTWIEDAAAHYEAEERLNKLEEDLRKKRNRIKRGKVAPAQEPATTTPKITKQAKRNADYEERLNFAESFYDLWIKQHPYMKEPFNTSIPSKTDPDLSKIKDALIKAFANGTLKAKGDGKAFGNSKVFLFGEWHKDEGGAITKFSQELIQSWRDKQSDEQWENEEYINELREALLDKAKLMQVAVYDNGVWHFISGQERYKYLDEINWIVLVKDSYHNKASDTYETTAYPVRSYANKELAKADFPKTRVNAYMEDSSVTTSTRTYNIVPIWEVDINKISGMYDF